VLDPACPLDGHMLALGFWETRRSLLECVRLRLLANHVGLLGLLYKGQGRLLVERKDWQLVIHLDLDLRWDHPEQV
jgi:hypothetical protein